MKSWNTKRVTWKLFRLPQCRQYFGIDYHWNWKESFDIHYWFPVTEPNRYATLKDPLLSLFTFESKYFWWKFINNKQRMLHFLSRVYFSVYRHSVLMLCIKKTIKNVIKISVNIELKTCHRQNSHWLLMVLV